MDSTYNNEMSWVSWMTPVDDEPTRESWLLSAIDRMARSLFPGFKPPRWRVTCGWPKGVRGGKHAIDERNVHTRRCGTSYPPGTYYVDFADATASREHADMPQGWDKYEDWRRHEKHARRIALTIAQAVFPELRGIATDTLPLLWINRSEMPHALNEPSGHATVDTHYYTLCGFIGCGHAHTKAA